MRIIRLLPLMALAFSACPRRAALVRQLEPSLTVFVTGDLDLDALPRQAAAVRQARDAGPCLWLMCGDVLRDRLRTELSDGAAPARLLDAAGVDAVLLGPEWMRLGEARAQTLASGVRFYLLCANVTGYYGAAIGQEFMVKSLRGGNGPNRLIDVGVTGLWSDSTSVVLRQNEVEFGAPAFDGARLAKFLRMRAGLTCVLVRGGAIPTGFDLVAGTPASVVGQVLAPSGDPAEMSAYDVVIANGSVQEVRRRYLRLADIQPHELTATVLDSLRQAVDSLAAVPAVESQVAVPPQALSRAIARYLVGERLADHVVYDMLARDTVRPGMITQGRLVEVLEEPGRLLITELTGSQLKELRTDRSVQIETRRILKQQRQAARRRYEVAMTTGFLVRHPELAVVRYRFADVPLWQQAAAMLRNTGGNR